MENLIVKNVDVLAILLWRQKAQMDVSMQE